VRFGVGGVHLAESRRGLRVLDANRRGWSYLTLTFDCIVNVTTHAELPGGLGFSDAVEYEC